MRQRNKIKIMLIFSILLLIPSIFHIVTGDGCIFIPTVEEWVHIDEEKQISVIDYENGTENLTILVDVKNSSLAANEAFWIFPIPGDPTDIDIGITQTPEFYYGGYRDVRDGVKESVADSFMMLGFSQAYLSMIPFFYYLTNNWMMGTGYDEENDVTIHETAEKMGFTSQLISANDRKKPKAINDYLESKNITLSSAAGELIAEYIGQDFCFVVSWISDIDQFKNQTANNIYHDYYWYYEDEPVYMLGISVEFPTNEIYYPMKLTSIYDKKIIPILIQINGHVSPKNTYSQMYTSYYTDDGPYTEIQIHSQASEFTEDFYIENKEPIDVQNAKFIKNNTLIFTVIVFILCSIFASIFSAFVTYRKDKPDYKKFALLGLTNFLSIFFVFAMCFVLKINKNFVKNKIEEKNVSEFFDKGFKITFLVLGLVCLLLFLTMLINLNYLGMLIFFILTIFAIVFGVIMLVYGAFKNPKVTLYTVLFSIFFLIFLVISTIAVQIAM